MSKNLSRKLAIIEPGSLLVGVDLAQYKNVTVVINQQAQCLDGSEFYSKIGLNDELSPGQEITIKATKQDGSEIRFQTICRIDTPVEVEYHRNGGILQAVLRDFLKDQSNS